MKRILVLIAILTATACFGPSAEEKLQVELLSMSPYLITILVLVVISSDRSRAATNAPASLGRSFHASS